MRNDMGSVLFRGSSGKSKKVRRRINLPHELTPSTAQKVLQMDFRLGEEPEHCQVVRYICVREASSHGGWVTAEVVLGGAARVEQDQPLDTMLDEVSTREPMRGKTSHWRQKELKLSTAVTRRFLSSRVGRNWGLVLGEIRRGSDRRTFQGHMLEQCVRDIVVTNVEEVDGQLFDVEFSAPLCNSPERFRYYVHPRTGNLEHMPRASKRARQKRKQETVQRPEQVDVKALTKLVRVEGIWYVVDFQPIPTLAEVLCNQQCQPGDLSDTQRMPQDIILKQDAVNDPSRCYRRWPNKLTNYTVDSLRQAWGAEIYAVSKRQAAHRDLMRHGVSGQEQVAR